MKITPKQALILVVGALAFQSSTLATTVAPQPTFEEVAKAAKLIGVVKIVAVPEAPKDGFTDAAPPMVGVVVTESLHGLKKDAELKIRWSTGFRPDMIMSTNSFMPIAGLKERKVILPKVNDEYFVFLEEDPKGGHRDIYGWKKLIVSPKPVAKEPEPSFLWAWHGVLKSQPLADVSRAHKASRHHLSYEPKPTDAPCVQEAFLNFGINASGTYWLLTNNGAVKHDFVLKGKKKGFVLRHTVAKGETLSRIAEEYYYNSAEEKWKLILNANRAILKDEKSLKEGMTLIIPDDASK